MRNTRINAISEQVRIMAAANKVIVPPETVPLTAIELKFFNNIIAENAKANWSAHQLELAAMLASMMASYIREKDMLEDEGAVVSGSMGSAILNPRKQVVQMHANNIVAMRRSLALHAASVEPKEDAARKMSIAKSYEAQSPFDEDNLIARPVN